MNGSPPSSPPASTSACPCEVPQDPQVVTNPPGLTSISDRVDDFTGFRRALLRPLPGEQALGIWRPAAGDLGLQFLEWWAYIADVLTFYNERIANESYLGTAQCPASIAGLAGLSGYVPSPGLAATGQVGAIRTITYPAEPLVIQAGMQLSSTPTPGVPAQTFEAVTASFPGPSDAAATVPPNQALDMTDGNPASVLLAGKITGTKAGDRLLLVHTQWKGADDYWSVVTVGTVAPETDPGTGAVNTRVTFTSGAVWGTGTTATPPSPVNATDYRLMKSIAAASLWSLQQGASPPTAVAGLTVNLSTTVRSIQPGDLVFFDTVAQAAPTPPSLLAFVTATADQLDKIPYPVRVVHEESPHHPPPPTPEIVVPYTALTLNTPDQDVLSDYDPAYSSGITAAIAVRYGFRDVGTVLPNPVGTLPPLPATVLLPTGFVMPDGVATALLEDSTGVGTVVQVAPATDQDPSPDVVALTLSPAPPAPSTFATALQVPLRLIFDVVTVSRGATVSNEVLGSGNAAVANQSFPLSKSPLTYLASGTGSTAALTVSVDKTQWSEVPTLYNQPPRAQVYVVERAPDQTTTIRFGDGVNGSRLTSGIGNVVATYRYGSGAASPPAGRLTTIVQKQPNLAAIHSPLPVTGGADPQAPGDVQTAAPASVFTFGQAVSALDYEAVAGQAAGVSLAKAYWTYDATAQRSLVKIYVNDDAGGVATATQALAGSGDPNRPVTVAAAQPIALSVSAALVLAANAVASDVVAAAATALTDPTTGAFSLSQMGVGQWLYRSRVASALSVPGVVAVRQLAVTWTATSGPLDLGQVADPGEGAYFQLSPGNLTLTTVTAND
jgi:hypothetical protein